MDSKDLSVVVQGAISKKHTSLCLKSLRKFLPDSEIILSSWQGSNVSKLDFDKCILSKDPGGNVCSRDGKGINNCNREIVSTKAGINLATKKFILKIRSDIILKNSNILKINFLNKKRDDRFSFLSDRVLVCSIYSRLFAIKDGNKLPILFHPSDWIYLGYAEDIKNLFDIPLTQEPEFSLWFKDREQHRNGYVDVHPHRLWKFAPESYIWISCLKKYIDINCEDKLDISDELIELSKNTLVNNFYMADQPQLGINLEKYNIIQAMMPKIDSDGLYSNFVWQNEYKERCDRNFHVTPTSCEILSRIITFFKIKRNRR